MATSGTITGSTNNSNLTFLVKWSVVDQDEVNLTSTVKFRWIMRRSTTATTTYDSSAPWTQRVSNGTPASSSGTISFDIRSTAVNADYEYRTATTVVIQHKTDGTRTSTVSATLDLSGTSAGMCSLSGQIPLPDIPVNPPTDANLTVANGGTAASVGAYVGGFSKLVLTGSATMGEVPITSFSFYRDATLMGTVSASQSSGTTYTGTLTMTTAEPTGTYVYSVVATDTKGLTARYSLPAMTMLAYSTPVISVNTYRSDNQGNPSNDETYGYCYLAWEVANIGSNVCALTSVQINGNDHQSQPGTRTGNVSYLEPSLSTSLNYDVIYTITDTLGGTATITQTIPTSYINFDLFPSASEGGAAFGQEAEKGKFIVSQNEAHFKMKGNDGEHYDAYTLPVAGAINTNTDYDILTTKNIADPDINGTYTTSNISNSKVFTSISVGSQIKIEWTQFGKMVFANFTVSRGAATSAGSTMFEAVIDPDYLPLVTACSAGYYSGACVVGKYDTNGNFTCRVTAAQVAANNAVQIGISFMLA